MNQTGCGKSDEADKDEEAQVDETIYKWEKKEPAVVDTSFSGAQFTCSDNVDELSPLMYLKMFWDDDITQNIAEQTNLNSVQQTGSSSTTKNEIERLLGLQMKINLVKMQTMKCIGKKRHAMNKFPQLCLQRGIRS